MKLLTGADWIILAAALALLPFLYTGFRDVGGRAELVEIRVGGASVTRLPLGHNRSVTVPGTIGPSTIEIKDGRARFAASPCRNQICVHSGWQARGGESAACLPNRVSLSILARNQAFDAINH